MTVVWCRSCDVYHRVTGAWWLDFKEHLKKVRKLKVKLKLPSELTEHLWPTRVTEPS